MSVTHDDDDRVDISDVLFEWYPPKAKSNLKKHHVSFEEASTVFGDKRIVDFPDSAHSENELRYFAVGRSQRGLLLTVVFTPTDTGIRIISARRSERWERRHYEIVNDQE